MDAGGGTVAVLIRTVAETGSTNADLLAAAAVGAEEGVWLRANRQTAGRGRQGRHWVSDSGNLYASTIVRLRPGDPPAASLALVAAVALEEAIATFLPAAAGTLRIKWPNDLLLDGAKLSGILLERQAGAVVIGFGANLAGHPALDDRTTTSLQVRGVTLAPEALLDVLAEAFARWLSRWRGQGLAPVRSRWLERAHAPGTALTARLADGHSIDGLFDGLDADGALLLRDAGGTRHVVHAADVLLL